MNEKRCSSCVYTKADVTFHLDHGLCSNSGNAPWEKGRRAAKDWEVWQGSSLVCSREMRLSVPAISWLY
jgi:hypothetical protein